MITTVAGFYLGSSGPMDWLLLMHTLCGTLLVAGGTAALNQYVERDMDAVMRRTASRPLPSGQLQPREVLIFGFGTIVLGAVWLAIAVTFAGCLVALATRVLYLGVYTPLKTRTTLATAVGRDPRCVASADWLGCGAWFAFAGRMGALCNSVFLAISALHGHRLDVSRRLCPRGNPHAAGCRSHWRRHVPPDRLHLGHSGLGERAAVAAGHGRDPLFFRRAGAGMLLLQVGLWANRSRTNARAKWLMHATVAHIPLLLVWMIVDKLTR